MRYSYGKFWRPPLLVLVFVYFFALVFCKGSDFQLTQTKNPGVQSGPGGPLRVPLRQCQSLLFCNSRGLINPELFLPLPLQVLSAGV